MNRIHLTLVACGALWISCLNEAQAQKLLEWNTAAARCFEFPGPEIGSSAGAVDADRLLDEAEKAKERACQAAEKLLRQQQIAVAVLREAVDQLSAETLFWEANKTAEAVKEAGIAAMRAAVDVLGVTPQITIENSGRLLAAENTLTQSKSQIATWARNWDALHQAGRNNPARQILELAADEKLPPDLRERLDFFIQSLPGFLFRRSPAPRTALDAYRRTVKALERALVTMKEVYVSDLKRKANDELVAIVAPEVLRQEARRYFSMMKDRSRPDAAAVALLAFSQGACRVAQSVLLDEMDWIKALSTESPAKFRPWIAEEVSRDLTRMER
jgi:hypothetical protein